jgi:excisionase family DNA binding protein
MGKPQLASANQETAEPTPWLTVPEGARRAKCGPKVIYNAVRRRKLRAVRVGNAFRIHVEWLDCWLEAQATVVNPEAPGREIPFAVRRS